jgi:hypothetical protein
LTEQEIAAAVDPDAPLSLAAFWDVARIAYPRLR